MPPKNKKGNKKNTAKKMSQCGHVKKVHPQLSWALINSRCQDHCSVCPDKCTELWLCMTCLRSFGCHGDDIDHAFNHVQREGHALAMNMESRRFWCYLCKCEVYKGSHNHPEFNIPEVGATPIDWDSITTQWVSSEPPKGLVGLRNLGNTCYMNSALQCLSNCPAMTSYFLSLADNDIHNPNKQRVANGYRKLMQEMWDTSKPGQIAIPTDLLRAIQAKNTLFRGFMQQDTQELLRCLIDFLHEDLKSVVTFDPPNHAPPQNSESEPSIPKHSSIIGDLFNGLISSSVRCLYCNKVSVTRETFQDLSLPIPSGDQLQRLHNNGKSEGGQPPSPTTAGPLQQKKGGSSYGLASYLISWVTYPFSWLSSISNGLTNYWSSEMVTLEDCLSLFFTPDDLVGDNMYSCENCKKLRNGVKEVSITSLPEVMCVHLKRFRHDLMHSSKIGSYVSFPVQSLNLTQYMKSGTATNGASTLYNLTGVICHHGSVSGGHYTAFALHPANGNWYEYDDSYVNQVAVETVQQCQAYVLFYTRDDTAQRHFRQKFETLALQSPSSNLLQFYVSKLWLLKLFSCANPGPTSNSTDFLCIHGQVRPSMYADIHDRVVAVSAQSWQLLNERHGGGTAVNNLVKCGTCATTLHKLKLRQEEECEEFGLCREKPYNNLYALSTTWYQKWERFIKAETDTPPGPIDNKPIAVFDKTSSQRSNQSERYNLRRRSAYASINGSTWRFLQGRYGGGPVVVSQHSDELSDTSDEEEEVRCQQATPTPTTVSEIESESTYTSTSVSQLDEDIQETPPIQVPPASQSDSSIYTTARQDNNKGNKSKSDTQINIHKHDLRSSSKPPRKGQGDDTSLSDQQTSEASSGYQTLSKK